MVRRLNRMNGWQRLWFAGTVLAVVVFGLLHPFMAMSQSRTYEYQWAIEKDYQNPTCTTYLREPFEQLSEPTYGLDQSTCWHIYTTREFEEGHRAYLTFDEWVAQDNSDWWGRVAAACAAMSLFVVVVAGLVYVLGKVIAWIIRGFRTA